MLSQTSTFGSGPSPESLVPAVWVNIASPGCRGLDSRRLQLSPEARAECQGFLPQARPTAQAAHNDVSSCVNGERFLVCLKNQKAYLLILKCSKLACSFL